MIIHMIDSLSDHGITLRLYRFGISSSAGKMASREARNISCHPQAAKQPHGAVIGMHRPRPVAVQSNLGSIRPGIALALTLALATVLKVVLFLDQRQQSQREEREHGNRHRDVVATEPDRNADRAGGPQARGRRGTLHSRSLLEDRAATDEADAGDQAFDHFRHAVRGMRQQVFAGLHEAAACQRDQREGAQARAARPLLAVPADRRGERKGRRQRQKMNAYLKSVQSSPR